MSSKTRNTSVQAIIQALNAAETNIKLAKSLLSGASLGASKSASGGSPKDIPGIMGVFDGTHMVDGKEGKKYKVNPNYASKSRLVVGDTLKMIEQDGKNFFKQVEKVDREKLEGVLSKKGDRYIAVTEEGEYQLLPEAVEFYGEAVEGAKLEVLVPKDNKKVPFAALNDLTVPVEKKPKDEEKGEVKRVPAATQGSRAQRLTRGHVGRAASTSAAARPKKEVVVEEKTPPAAPAEPAVESVEDDEELR